MADRNHPDHISNLTDEKLEELHKSLTSLKQLYSKGGKVDAGESMSVQGPYGVAMHISGGMQWKPDLAPVDKALSTVHDEMLERHLLTND